jgi:hypothetical protein
LRTSAISLPFRRDFVAATHAVRRYSAISPRFRRNDARRASLPAAEHEIVIFMAPQKKNLPIFPAFFYSCMKKQREVKFAVNDPLAACG